MKKKPKNREKFQSNTSFPNARSDRQHIMSWKQQHKNKVDYNNALNPNRPVQHTIFWTSPTHPINLVRFSWTSAQLADLIKSDIGAVVPYEIWALTEQTAKQLVFMLKAKTKKNKSFELIFQKFFYQFLITAIYQIKEVERR